MGTAARERGFHSRLPRIHRAPKWERFYAAAMRRRTMETMMPAKSKAQQKAAGAALSAKRGDTPKSKLQGASKQMASSMSEKQLEEFASTKRKGKPEHVSD
jgi:hypothetical protein